MSFMTPASPKGRAQRQTAIRKNVADLDTAMMCRHIRETYALATQEQRQAGATWYNEANDAADGDTYNVGVLAALSPGTSWERNVTLLDIMLKTGDAPHAYGDSIRKARAIWEGADPNTTLGGRKVRSFYANCLRPTRPGAVTIDRHAASIALLGPSAQRLRRSATLSDSDLKILTRVGTYTMIAACYRGVARELGLLPHQLQAVTWLVWRESYAYSTTHEEF